MTALGRFCEFAHKPTRSVTTPRSRGAAGSDTFDLTPGSRPVFVDGGAPTGKKKSTDKLTVFSAAPRPSITHSAATQDPDAGLVSLDYGTARFLVQYDDVEGVVIKKL